MGLVATKSVFVISDKAKFKPTCSTRETSWKIEIWLVASPDMILSNEPITKALIRLRWCAGWSVGLLFANPQRQVFSRRGSKYKCTCSGILVDKISNVFFWVFINIHTLSTKATKTLESLCKKNQILMCWLKNEVMPLIHCHQSSYIIAWNQYCVIWKGNCFLWMRWTLNSVKLLFFCPIQNLRNRKMLFDGLDFYPLQTLNSAPWHINWFLNLCWNWKNAIFLQYPLKTNISVEKFNECLIINIAQFLNFALKIQLVYAMKQLNW